MLLPCTVYSVAGYNPTIKAAASLAKPKECTVRAKCALFVMWAAMVGTATAQTFTTLLEFNGNDGGYPSSGLVQGVDGNLYGEAGTLFEVTPTGKLKTIFSFLCNDSQCLHGGDPSGGLILGTDGFWYGSTTLGGSSVYNNYCVVPGGVASIS